MVHWSISSPRSKRLWRGRSKSSTCKIEYPGLLIRVSKSRSGRILNPRKLSEGEKLIRVTFRARHFHLGDSMPIRGPDTLNPVEILHGDHD